MKNDSYEKAVEKAREIRLKRRIERHNTPMDKTEDTNYDSMSISEIMNYMKDSINKLKKDLDK